MFFELPPGGEKFRAEFPTGNLLYHADLPALDPVANEEAAIASAIDRPIGLPSLGGMVKAGARVVIVADDLTRPTPQALILPLLLDRLNALGVPDERISIVIGLGTHRPMTDEEIRLRFGAGVVRRVPIYNHDFRDPRQNVFLGTTASGTPVEINRRVLDADLRILAGTVIPHNYAGWGGGAKMIQPGVCSERTTASTHCIAGTYADPLALPGEAGNPIRREMEAVAGQVGPIFIVNTVNGKDGRLLGCFAGHYIKAHRAAVALAERACRPRIPALADIVISSAHPCDRDFWQGFKAFSYAHLGLRPGGCIIYAIAAPEGLAGDAPGHAGVIREWAARKPEEIMQALAAGEIGDRIAGSMCVAHARLLARAPVVCVSPGLDEMDVRALGFRPAGSIEEALKWCYARLGGQARIGVIPYGGDTLVRLDGEGGTASG